MEELRKYILEKALSNGVLCVPGAEGIATAQSVDDMLKMYVKYIDYCLEHNFPSTDDLVRIAGVKLIKFGIHVDNEFGQMDPLFTVLLGKCKANLTYTGYAFGQVFVKHQSTADLELNGNSIVMVDCFDDSVINVVANDWSKITINVYGRAKISKSGSGHIKIINKLKETY